MGRISKVARAEHEKAMELINSDKPLSYDEKFFILENYQESMNHAYQNIGSFFTPIGMAQEFSICLGGKRVIDLCAGIGHLSFFAYHMQGLRDITCVEYNAEYVKIGKRILPEANWIVGNILDQQLMQSLGKFSMVYGNPPFGQIKTGSPSHIWFPYSGNDFEYKAAAVASTLSDFCIFILPQGSLNFRYSGKSQMEKVDNQKAIKFLKDTGFEMSLPLSTDLSIYDGQWKNTNIKCDFVEITF